MAFQRSFFFLTYLTAIWSFVSLASTGELHLWAIVAFSLILLAAIGRRRFRFELPGFIWLLITIAVFCGALWGWFRLGERMYSVTYFLMYLEANKLLTAKSNRDYIQIYGLTFFQMLAASVSTTSVLFAPLLGGYLLLIIATMIAFTIKRDAERTFQTAKPGKKALRRGSPWRMMASDRRALEEVGYLPFLTRRMVSRLALATGVVVLLGGGLFLVIPRAARQDFLPGLGRGHQGPRKSGFADHVAFGGVGRIQNDPTIVMRVIPTPESTLNRPTFLRIRGTALDEFTGRQWQKSAAMVREIKPMRAQGAQILPPSLLVEYGEPFRADINLDPERSNYIFTVNQPARVILDKTRTVELDPEGLSLKLETSQPRYQPITYQVEGRIPRAEARSVFEADPLASTREDEDVKPIAQASLDLLRDVASAVDRGITALSTRSERNDRQYLQTPETPDMENIREMAMAWTAGIDSPRARAEEVERRFRTEFDYTLEADFADRPNHLTHFLRVAREGHCEYFATSMVLMLRSLGIPARIVNGYLTDEWNRTGQGYYVVRQEHAHSWVEVRFPDSPVWVTFDPTPASGLGSNRIHRTWFHRWSAVADAMKLVWYNLVVDYDVNDQRKGILASIRAVARGLEALQSGTESARLWWESGGDDSAGRGGRWVLVGAGGALTIGALGYFVVLLRRRRERAGEDPEQQVRTSREDVRPYLDLMRDLGEVFPRPQGQTPRDFARIVVDRSGGALEEFVPLTDRYYTIRYNGDRWDPELDRRIAALRQRLRDMERTPASQPALDAD
ncbi:MAG: DUF3488 and transglutaminase-like domain-containing protein [Sumerlaeia bacterium]